MPISGWDPIYPVMAKIQGIDPKSVLDVGIGTGQWGFLVRNYHDLRYGRFKSEQWQVKLDGIEACQLYQNPAWSLYSNVLIMDAWDFVEKRINAPVVTYDVAIMIEVLEHFDKDRGINMLHGLKSVAKHLIFSYANMEQGAAHGNEYEVHRSTWSDEEVRAIFPQAEQIYETGVGKFYYVKL